MPTTRPLDSAIGNAIRERNGLAVFSQDKEGGPVVTKTIDPVGRTFSYVYAANGIDLLETRQTRAGQSELLSKMTYDAHHRPPTITVRRRAHRLA
jgi:hypothetical protein